MDNISHTLISIGLGATVARRISPAGQRYGIWTAIIAGNLPDADLLTSFFSKQSKLVYLLHHRGHTHTIPYALLSGLLIGWIAWKIFSKKTPFPDTSSRTVLIVTAVLSSFLHLFMDWWNLYGVHPFYPFNNRWFYGDAVFIVEPLIWMSMVPFCFRISEKLRYKTLTALLPVAALSLAVIFKIYVVAGMLIGWLLLASFWDQKKPAQHVGFFLTATAICAFFIGSFLAEGPARSNAVLPEGAQLLDAGLSPAPANPFCWKFYTASIDGEDFVVRTGTISHIPNLIQASNCFFTRDNGQTANLTAVEMGDSHIHLDGEYRIAKKSIIEIKNCEFNAFKIFARMPFIEVGRLDTVFGDLRFDSEKGLGFSEFILNPAADCEGINLPPWVPPREDLFGS